MDWQELTALGIVVATAAAFLWSRFRPRQFSFHRDTHCGCSSPSGASTPSVVLHVRKGERPTLIVRNQAKKNDACRIEQPALPSRH